MMRKIILTAIFTSLLLIPVVSQAQTTVNTSAVRLWLERADLMRGPEVYGEDNYYNSFMMGSGSFRNFTANACFDFTNDGPNCTQAIDGTAAWDATAPISSTNYHKDVLHATSQTTWAPCGQWLNSNISYGGVLYGFAHGERPGQTSDACNTNYGTHHKTMTLWQSTDAGLNWSNPVEIIDSTDGDPTNGNPPTTESGEGDCTAINDSTYAYLFCRHPVNTGTELARAPLSSLGNSDSFIKYDNGWGSQPGINGSSSEISGVNASTGATSTVIGSSASYWQDKNWVMLLDIEDSNFKGLKTSFTPISDLQSNSISFTTLPEPLFIQETNSAGHYPYQNNPPVNLYIYPSAVSLADGTRNWAGGQDGQFLLAYTFVPPTNTLQQRILAMRSVTVQTSTQAEDPQVLVALTTRYDSNYNQTYSSTQPLAAGPGLYLAPNSTNPGFTYIVNNTSGNADRLGYLAQKPTSQGQTLIPLWECHNNSSWPASGHPDQLITRNSCDNGYTPDTLAGYSFPTQPVTDNGSSAIQIYRCKNNATSSPSGVSPNGTHWVSAHSNCQDTVNVGGQTVTISGTMESSLGWVFTR